MLTHDKIVINRSASSYSDDSEIPSRNSCESFKTKADRLYAHCALHSLIQLQEVPGKNWTVDT